MTAVPDFGVVHDAPWLEVCFHEAGHAVAMDAGGFVVLSVEANGDGTGRTYTDRPERLTPAQVRAYQVVCAAGGAAQEVALTMFAHQARGEASRREHSCVSGDLAICDDLDREPGAIGWDRAYGEAMLLLEPRWDEIERVAYELSLTGRLAGSRV